MSALSRAQFHRLDLACEPIRDAFGTPPYLVGTAATKGNTWRDVDVRLILDDATYAGQPVEVWRLLGLVTSNYLESVTGLPVDFQVQQKTAANELHKGIRNPLGMRALRSLAGDAEARPQPEAGGCP